jgi:hypothetical protein
MDPNHPDYHNDFEYDVPPHIIEYDPSYFPSAHEDCIGTFLPRTNKYKENISQYHGKYPGSINILKKEEYKKDKEREQAIKYMVKEKLPSQPYIENIPYVNFNEGSLALMWPDKRKGNLKYDKKSEVL